MRYALITLVKVIVSFELAAAQTVTGIVVDGTDNEPVAGVVIALADSAGVRLGVTETKADGSFELRLERAGRYTLSTQRLGYLSFTSQPLTILSGAELEFEIRLERAPIASQAVEVRTRSRVARLERAGFYTRRDKGIGRFLTAEDIRKRGSLLVSDLLRTEPSVRIVYNSARPGWDVVFRGATTSVVGKKAPCVPLVVVDGVRVRTDHSMGLDELVEVSEIEGLELYPGSAGVPAQYSGMGALCGVILLWLKR